MSWNRSAAAGACEAPPRKGLSFLDEFLTIWIFVAMGIGLGLGYLFPELADALDSVQVFEVSLPIAVGLLVMMYPPLAKVRYDELGRLRQAKKMLGTSLLLNWAVGPVLMFSLAWLAFPGTDEASTSFRNGLILIGLARCIAMVLVWNMLAEGDCEYCAVLVALNSLFQIFMYSVLAYLLITVMTPVIAPSAEAAVVDITMAEIARNVLIFLGIPFALGVASWFFLARRKGREWYDRVFAPRISPLALVGLLFTIVIMFALQGEEILSRPWEVVRVALPLLAYFLLMFFLSFALSHRLGFTYGQAATQSFTAASNNFELAIAVAVATFTISSIEAFTAVIGPLMEVPVLIGLVNVALWIKRRFYRPDGLPLKARK
ncbi:MAG: arsenical-resistance protein [Euryarchaeota archaeon RBG_16_62_10]|nr:MAG: arsenical-resistance protein [Euryarchaeota archaeon RBG_16_62_10]